MDTLETNSKTNRKAVLWAQTPFSKNINGTGSHSVQKIPRVVAVPLVRFSHHSEECVRNGRHVRLLFTAWHIVRIHSSGNGSISICNHNIILPIIYSLPLQSACVVDKSNHCSVALRRRFLWIKRLIYILLFVQLTSSIMNYKYF